MNDLVKIQALLEDKVNITDGQAHPIRRNKSS